MPLRLRGMLRTTVFARCPACAAGRIFRGPYAVREACSACGVRFDRYRGNWLGPTVIAYGVAGMAAAVAGYALARERGFFDGLVWVLAIVAVVVALVTLRFAKSWWIWLLWATGLVFTDEEARDDASDEGFIC